MYYPSWHKIEEKKKVAVLGKLMASDPDLQRTSSMQTEIHRLTIGLIVSTLPEPFKMLKTGQRSRSSVGRDPGHLLSSEISRWRAPRLERGYDPAEGSRCQYADGCALHRGPDNGHGLKGQSSGGTFPVLGFVAVLAVLVTGASQSKKHGTSVDIVERGLNCFVQTDAIFINEPRCTHTDVDVDEVKKDNKRLRKELLLRTVVRSDNRMFQLLTQLDLQHEVGGGNGSGEGEDNEPSADEDAERDEES
ncbi:hypothetical protein Tco_1554825 [Tanacetum coccineum]